MPISSLPSSLPTFSAHLPNALVPPDALARIGEAVAHLPASATRDIYFECRLAKRASRVDCIVALTDSGASLLSARGTYPLERLYAAHPPWRRLLTLCGEQTDAGSPLHALVHHLWLEYDVGEEPAGDPLSASVPSIYLSLRRAASTAPSLHPHVVPALRMLLGHDIAAALVASISNCFESRPATSHVPYIGLMIRQGEPTVRLCIQDVPSDAVEHYVEATARISGGEPAAVMRRLACSRYGSYNVPRVAMLHLDITQRGEILPRVGLERSFARRSQLTGAIDENDRQLLHELAATGLGARSKLDAMSAWPGRSVAIMPHELCWSILTRRVNHIKFVVEPCGVVDVKAYLYTNVSPRRRRGRGD